MGDGAGAAQQQAPQATSAEGRGEVLRVQPSAGRAWLGGGLREAGTAWECGGPWNLHLQATPASSRDCFPREKQALK